MSKFMKWALCIGSALGLVALDQITKKLAESYLAGKGTIEVAGNFFVLLFVQNRGGMLSLGNELNELLWWIGLVLVPVAVLAFFTYYVVSRKSDSLFYLVMWVLVAAGGVGNLIDRILVGKVTDFMNVGIGWLRSGIFNVADLYITVAVAVILVRSFLPRKKKPVDHQPEWEK